MLRKWNFSAGPSVLPREILERAAEEILDWRGSGLSVMEMSHRSKEFIQICDEAESDLRELLGLSDDYIIMFMQGGGLGENAIIPMNLIGIRNTRMADFIITGYWSMRSYKEAQRYGDINVAANSGSSVKIDHKIQKPWTWVPPVEEWKIRSQTSYLHLCSNETIGGVEIDHFPNLSNSGIPDVPLVIDASSNFLSRPLNISRVGLLFACAQKNAGPAGVTIVIVRRDLIGKTLPICPSVFNYRNVAAEHSRYNTPPTFSIYIMGLVFKWLKKQGGIKNIAINNAAKAKILYDYLDNSTFYKNLVHTPVRSKMNIPFFLNDCSLNKIFLQKAAENNLVQLNGHKSVGGMRASIYNAMPIEGVKTLVSYMKDFEYRYG